MTSLPRQFVGAVLWGIFIAAAPFEIVFGGSIVWVPLRVWRERVRALHYGFWSGFLMRFAVVLFIVAGAANAPKNMDTLVGPLTFDNICLHDLCRQLSIQHGIPLSVTDDLALEDRISFKTTTAMPRREVVTQLAKATDRTPDFAGCLNGGSILSGIYGTYYLHPMKANSTPTAALPIDSPTH